jgi:hypothetical protein
MVATLLLPAAATACGGGFGWSSPPDVVLTASERLWIHGRALLPVLLAAGTVWRTPTSQGRMAWARPSFLLLASWLWLGLLAAGISTRQGFLGPDTIGYGSFPLAVEAALILATPIFAWSLLRRTWLWFRSGGERHTPAPTPTPQKKAPQDGGGREEPAHEGMASPGGLFADGAVGAVGCVAIASILSAVEVALGGPPFGLLRILTGLG